jgi:hypothetical protein
MSAPMSLANWVRIQAPQSHAARARSSRATAPKYSSITTRHARVDDRPARRLAHAARNDWSARSTTTDPPRARSRRSKGSCDERPRCQTRLRHPSRRRRYVGAHAGSANFARIEGRPLYRAAHHRRHPGAVRPHQGHDLAARTDRRRHAARTARPRVLLQAETRNERNRSSRQAVK